KLHRRVIVIVKQHLVERGPFELPLSLGSYRLLMFWSVYRHNTIAILSYGEWGMGLRIADCRDEGSKPKLEETSTRQERNRPTSGIRNPQSAIPHSPLRIGKDRVFRLV